MKKFMTLALLLVCQPAAVVAQQSAATSNDAPLTKTEAHESLKILEARAQDGDTTAQRYLGYILASGEWITYGIEQDIDSGVEWLEVAGSKGDSEAYVILHDLYSAGLEGKKKRTCFSVSKGGGRIRSWACGIHGGFEDLRRTKALWISVH